ncbi:NUDIX domain-containing protein [Guptibacillus hwajinpoensis]|uniref:NUDIX domain-containing protein n=1 Tax=Guptibacillus hwajinpoensis TaxID=208199 RepID=UPI00273E7E36|nr:NUDIX domain-containing protein [Pseudalkalibacillus hwajinpoensis]WLR58727.1 NUDIX domain-containing protein [Pseudalkalibacillus hwajinpoensis]
MLRKRAGVILIENNQIALIERKRNGKVYYVIPGGGIETNETPEQAARREAVEELGVEVRLSELYCTLQDREEYYYKASIIQGDFGSGTGDEFTTGAHRRGTYKAVWVSLDKLKTLNVYPEELVQSLAINKGETEPSENKRSEGNCIRWVGSEKAYLDEPSCSQVGKVHVGRFGGNSSAGQTKNEDGCLVWNGGDWELAMVLDAHKTASSAGLILDEFERNRLIISSIIAKETREAMRELQPAVLALFQDEDFKQKCREVEGETACLLVVRKGKYLWWFSVGDCLLFLLHADLEGLGEAVQNHRSFYEWVGEVNTFDMIVPCFSTGTKELRKGINRIFLTTDDLLECPDSNFHQSEEVTDRLKGDFIAENVHRLLEEIKNKNVRDSTTILAWDINIVEDGLMASDQ